MTWLDPKKVLPIPFVTVLVKTRENRMCITSVDWSLKWNWPTRKKDVKGWMPLEWLEEELSE